MHELAVRHGRLITPYGPVLADLAIDRGRIAAIGKNLNASHRIDASGCLVLPGGVDCHVHLQMQLNGLTSTDSFETGTVAAACGGTTTVIDFVDPQPGQSLKDALRARRAEADGSAAVDYGLHMTVPAWHAASPEALREIPAALAAGCATFKLYQAYERMMLDDVALGNVMRAVATAGGGVVLHSETGPLIDALRSDAVAAGHSAPIWHERTRPAGLEASAVQRAAEIAALADCPLHIFHVGADSALAAVNAARAKGYDITAETCPHYLLLTAGQYLTRADGHLFICAPPLRWAADKHAMWQGLSEGGLDAVSTDHCPWTRAEKSKDSFSEVPGGLPGIESRLFLVHHFGVNEQDLALTSRVSACCTAPARRMGIQDRGALQPGQVADIVIFDPKRVKTLRAATLHEAADWSPFEGMRIEGWPRTVLQRGELLVRDEEFIACPGNGRYLHRTLAAS